MTPGPRSRDQLRPGRRFSTSCKWPRQKCHSLVLEFEYAYSTRAGARPEQFLSPVLKRHNPKTVRKNVGEGYHGCIRIEVKRGSDLYRKIEGWAEAIMNGC